MIQAKKYKDEYKPTKKQLNSELGKFGLTEDFPATRGVLASLIGKRADYCFILSTDGASVISKLQTEYSGEAMSCGRIKIRLNEGGASHFSEAVISVETINELWKGLLFDADSGSENNNYVAYNLDSKWVFRCEHDPPSELSEDFDIFLTI